MVIKKDFENGIIKSYNLFITEPCGKQGMNFIFELDITLSGGRGVFIEMNPRKIPQLLKMLKLDSIVDLPNTPIIVQKTDFEKPEWIQNFLASYLDKPFPVNDCKYYGSNLFIDFPVEEDFSDFLPKEHKRPPLGEKPDFSKDVHYKGHLWKGLRSYDTKDTLDDR